MKPLFRYVILLAVLASPAIPLAFFLLSEERMGGEDELLDRPADDPVPVADNASAGAETGSPDRPGDPAGQNPSGSDSPAAVPGEEIVPDEYRDELHRDFCAAIEGDDLPAVRRMLRLGADVNVLIGGTRPLHTAAESLDDGILKLLLEKGARVDTRDAYGQTPLHRAARFRIPYVEILVERGADLNARDARGWTPLHHAVDRKWEKMVRYLIARGCDVNAESNHGWTAYALAVMEGYEKLMPVLRDAGASVPESRQSTLNLLQACRFGRPGQARDALAAGGRINARDARGRPALIRALYFAHAELAAFLIGRGADVRARSDEGTYALHWAARRNFHAAAEKLLKAGASLNSLNAQEETALHAALELGDSKTFRFLLERGADPNLPVKGYRPLQDAVRKGAVDAVSLLLQKGAQVDAPSPWGETALTDAVSMVDPESQTEIVRLLINAGADVDQRDSEGRPVLMMTLEVAAHSVNRAFQAMVRDLLAAGAQPDNRDAMGRTTLHAAAALGNRWCAERLLEKGADVNAQDELGRTPLLLAQEGGQSAMADFLKTKGAR